MVGPKLLSVEDRRIEGIHRDSKRVMEVVQSGRAKSGDIDLSLNESAGAARTEYDGKRGMNGIEVNSRRTSY